MRNLTGNVTVGILGSGFTRNFNGYIDDLRVSKGIARWIDDFTIDENEILKLNAIAGNSKVDLFWNAVSGATQYIVKKSTDGTNFNEIATVNGTTFTDTQVSNNVAYSYQVTAIISSGNIDSNIVSIEPFVEPSGNRALLEIKMINGTEKEYDLTMEQVDTFVAWYESRGGDKPYYQMTYSSNKGPYVSRKDYLAFDKIVSFEVNEYRLEN